MSELHRRIKATTGRKTISPEALESAQHFERLLQKADFVACFVSTAHTYVTSLSSNPEQTSFDDIGYRVSRLKQVFNGQPKTSTLVSLMEDSDYPHNMPATSIASFTNILPLLFRAVIENDVYRQRRADLQKLLKRALSAPIDWTYRQTMAHDIMVELRENRRWETMERVGRVAHDSMGEWPETVLPLYLDAIDRLDRHHLAPTIDSLPDRLRSTLNYDTYDYLLKCHLSNRNLEAAKAILDDMLAKGLTPTQRTFEFVYSGYRPLGGYTTFLDDARQLNLAPTRQLLNQVLESLIREEGFIAGIQAVESLHTRASERLQAALQPRTYVDYITDSSTASHLQKAVPQSNNAIAPPPDRSTFGLMVRAYATIGDFDKALDTYKDMLEAGYKPNAFTLSALIAAYRSTPSERKNLDKGAEISGLLESDNLPVDAQSKILRSRLPDLLQSEGVEGLLRQLESMNAQGIRLDDRSVSIIYNYFAKSALADAPALGRALVNIRKAHGSSYRVTDVNILIQSFIEAEVSEQSKNPEQPSDIEFYPSVERDADAAASFHSIVEDLSSQGSKPDAYTLMLIMKRYADNRGSPRRLWDFFKQQFLEQGFKPNAHHISAIMTAFTKAGDVYGARRAMERGIALGVPPTIQHLTILLNFFIDRKSYVAAQQIVREMEERQLTTDLPVLVSLAKLEAKAGRRKALYQIEDQAKARFPDAKWPNTSFESLKLRCFLEQRKVTRGLNQLKIVLDQEGFVPDAHLLSVLSSAHRGARNALNRLKPGTPESAREAAKALAEQARSMKQQVAKYLQQQKKQTSKKQKDLAGQMKSLLELLNQNREIAGDYDVDKYTPELEALSSENSSPPDTQPQLQGDQQEQNAETLKQKQ